MLLLPNFQRSFPSPSFPRGQGDNPFLIVFTRFFTGVQSYGPYDSQPKFSTSFWLIFNFFNRTNKNFLERTAKIQRVNFTANFYCEFCSHSSHLLFIRYQQATINFEDLTRPIFKSGRKDKIQRFTNKCF